MDKENNKAHDLLVWEWGNEHSDAVKNSLDVASEIISGWKPHDYRPNQIDYELIKSHVIEVIPEGKVLNHIIKRIDERALNEPFIPPHEWSIPFLENHEAYWIQTFQDLGMAAHIKQGCKQWIQRVKLGEVNCKTYTPDLYPMYCFLTHRVMRLWNTKPNEALKIILETFEELSKSPYPWFLLAETTYTPEKWQELIRYANQARLRPFKDSTHNKA